MSLPVQNSIRLLVASAALSAAIATAATPAASWPRFHGPQGNNLSADTGLLKKWPAGGPKLVWKARGMGEGFSTVSIAGGLVYTMGNINDKTIITAVEMDGKPRWTAEDGKAWTGQHPGTRSTPTIDGDRLYAASPLGELVCLEAATGKPIWRTNILQKFGASNIRWALAESPIVDGNRLICTPGGPQTAVVALDKATGNVMWKSPTADGDAAGYATPALVEYQGLRMVLTLMAKALIGVNADTGDLLFRHEHRTNYDVNVLTPIFHDGQIFISTGYGAGAELIKVAVDGKKAKAERVWQSKDLDNHHGSVLLLDGYLYGANFKGSWVSLDWKTGKKMYAEKGIGKGSLTYADGMFYMLSENSKVGLVKAVPAAYELVSEFTLPKGGEGPSWAHPVVCGGRLYVRHGDFLYVYEVKQ
jgi:outer membrane protein assembly factor BamB